MSTSAKLVFFLYLGLSSTLGYGQAVARSEFQETTPPTDWKELLRLNGSSSYHVENVAGNLVVTLAKEKSYLTKLKIPGGTLIGKDGGEFCGELTFKAAGTRKPRVIKQGNVVSIFQQDNQIYFFEGLAHMSINEGVLYRLEGKAPHFSFIQLIAFDDAPEAFAIVGDKVYVAQSAGFTVLRNLKPEVVFAKTFWGSLYPNSVAVFDSDITYVGVRGGYVELNLASKKMRFFQKL